MTCWPAYHRRPCSTCSAALLTHLVYFHEASLVPNSSASHISRANLSHSPLEPAAWVSTREAGKRAGRANSSNNWVRTSRTSQRAGLAVACPNATTSSSARDCPGKLVELRWKLGCLGTMRIQYDDTTASTSSMRNSLEDLDTCAPNLMEKDRQTAHPDVVGFEGAFLSRCADICGAENMLP